MQGRWFAVVALLALVPLPTPAQTCVRGRVVQASDAVPIPDAVVAPVGRAGASVLTNAAGEFCLATEPGARMVAVRIGFVPETLSIAIDAPPPVFRLEHSALIVHPLVVEAERGFSAATSRVARELDLRLRPVASSQELLRQAPGLVIAQHAGGGKAEQIFLRGFDADHGTDVAITVDGVPVNMVSHAHGQGYADLHFLMPELVERVDVRKGPYEPSDGDFATAGAIALRTRDRLSAPTVAARSGSFGTAHAFAGVPFGGAADQAGGYVALSGDVARGPFDADQDHRRVNVAARFTAPLHPRAVVSLGASGFDARWNASGQIPERAVPAIGRFGAIDASEGGTTSRYDAVVGLRAPDESWHIRAFATRYDFDLFSNFTFFAENPVDGDGIEQVDDRRVLGADATWSGALPIAGVAARIAAGGGVRSDRADVALYAQQLRERGEPRVDARVAQQHLFAWTRYDLLLTDAFRLQLGGRADAFRFDVVDRHGDASGRAWTSIVSPRVSAAFDAGRGTTLFANAGAGFHSNDARAAVARESGRVLPRAFGAELGARRTGQRGSIGAAAWLLDLESELVWVGDEGRTEASGRSRRIGVETDARLRLAPWLWADADLNLSHGRFLDAPRGEDRVPLAPRISSTGGLTLRDAGPLEATLRYRYIGNRPADETGEITARGATLVEAAASWSVGRVTLQLGLDNLFDVEWNEAQFATTSRLLDEPAPVTELHFTPGAPRSIQLGATVRF